jgi:uroporphyrinogen-III decarboxylase
MRIPFEPVCFDHAAALIGESPWAVSRSADKLAEAHLAAIRRYHLHSCVVGMDIYNLEPEAYGAEVIQPSGNGMPTLAEETFTELDELSTLQLDPEAGRIPLLLDAAARIKSAEPAVQISIALSGAFTIASQLLGLENMICELFSEPEDATDALRHLAHQETKLIQCIRAAGYGITVYESAVTPPLLSPDLFTRSVFPALESILSAAGGGAQLIIGGNTLPILPEMLRLPTDYRICPVETDQNAFLAAMPPNWPGSLRINMNPSVFLPGKEQDARAELERVRQLAETRPDLTLTCGSLIPFDADPELIKTLTY